MTLFFSLLYRYLSVSTVIQKFLDTPHLPLLKQYMEKVAESPVMRPAYAAVLLSLYVQLRDVENLGKFIERSINDKGYMWDVDEAISTCLNGVFIEFCKECGAVMTTSLSRICFSSLETLNLTCLVGTVTTVASLNIGPH